MEQLEQLKGHAQMYKEYGTYREVKIAFDCTSDFFNWT